MNHVLCDGGLCNRLNALFFALILQRKFGPLGHDWQIAWPQNNWCGASFGSLFTSPLPQDGRSIEDFKQQQAGHLLLMHENQIGFDADRLILNRSLTSYDDYRRLLDSARADGLSVVYFNSLLPAFVQDDEVRDALQLLGLNPQLASTAGRFVETRQIDRSTLGLHIRKTDFGDLVDDQALFAQAQASPRRFFVCSDDAAVNQRFAGLPNAAVFEKSAFPEKLAGDAAWRHWTTDAEGRRFPFNITRSGASVVEGLIDLLILSQTEIVPTSGSTFLATARLFGRCGFFTPAVANTAAISKFAPAPATPPRGPAMTDHATAPVDLTAAIDATATSPAAPAVVKPVTQPELFNLLNLIRPWQMISDTKLRMGSDADGGYVMPSSSRRSNTVISIGIGNEVSFDNELARLGARVIQFDHTIAAAPSTLPGIEFNRLGWGARDEHPFVSLQAMVGMVDWDRAVHPILKFDTEGAEWSCLIDARSEDLDRFEVLTGEFHDFHNLVNRPHFDQVMAVFTKLCSTHRVIHLHANNAGGMVMLGGIPFPRLLELTFMRKRSASFHGHSSEPIPGPLDRPNVAQLPDLVLRAF